MCSGTGLCDQTLDTCNSAFNTCMQDKCDSLYTGFAHWRCSFVAGVYYRGVDNLAAATLFTLNSPRFCDCKCDDASLTACGTSCVDTSTDSDNCGSCYFHVSYNILHLGLGLGVFPSLPSTGTPELRDAV
jgi:hypothetical protein